MKIDTIICTVNVDGQLATEYKVEGSDLGKTKTCYIFAEESKPFSITVDLTSDPVNKNKQFEYTIWVDGLRTNRIHAHVGVKDFKPCISTTTKIQVPGSGGLIEMRPFKFGKCLTGNFFLLFIYIVNYLIE